ncbi:MAG: ATP-binding protein [Desulfobacterales bacterium]|nr:ATP-binding protein [Desulfobacterales bacterium]
MTKKCLSPFIVGSSVVRRNVPLDRFIDREEEIQVIVSQLFGAGRGSAAISGERRIGKTSLLHYLNARKVFDLYEIDMEKVLMTFVDCEGIYSFHEFWNQAATRFKIALSAGTYPETIVKEIDMLLTKEQISFSDILTTLNFFAQQEYYVILLVDEFDWLIREDTEESIRKTEKILYYLRNLLNHDILAGYFSMVVATRLPLDHTVKKAHVSGSPFHNIFIPQILHSFSSRDISNLCSIYPQNLDVQIHQDEIDLCYRLSGGYPYLFQMAMNIVFNIHALKGWETPVPDERILEKFEQQARQQFEFLWDYSSDEQKEVMFFIALREIEGKLSTGETLAINDISEIFSRLVSHVESLKQRGICIGETTNPKLFSPLFTKFVVKLIQAGDKDYWDERKTVFLGFIRESTIKDIISKSERFWDTNYASLKKELRDWTSIVKNILPEWPKLSDSK